MALNCFSSNRRVFSSMLLFEICNSSTLLSCFVGDELLSDSYPYKEIENGMLWEVEGKVS